MDKYKVTVNRLVRSRALADDKQDWEREGRKTIQSENNATSDDDEEKGKRERVTRTKAARLMKETQAYDGGERAEAREGEEPCLRKYRGRRKHITTP